MTVHFDSAKQAAEQERLRKEAERKKKEASASQSSEPASEKLWLGSIISAVVLALIWLVGRFLL